MRSAVEMVERYPTFRSGARLSNRTYTLTQSLREEKMKIVVTGALAVITAASLFAADAPAPALTVSAVRAAKAPVIDGDLSDEVWSKAPEITGFVQHDPEDGKPATQKTIV